jgi:hypothetical protein
MRWKGGFIPDWAAPFQSPARGIKPAATAFSIEPPGLPFFWCPVPKIDTTTPPLRPWWRSLGESSASSLVTAPVIYLGLVPIVLLDLFTTVYQALCFKDYGLQRVARKDYIILDRHKLNYLNLIERFNCDYCAYFNGVIAYAREVAGRTEAHFCPIRNATLRKHPHAEYKHFKAYGDAAGYDKIALEQLAERK